MCDTTGIGGENEVRYWWSSAIDIDGPFLGAAHRKINEVFAHSNHRCHELSPHRARVTLNLPRLYAPLL